jgi:hypothetical protein
MVLHGGRLVFGMVDRVPRVCYVATLFFHINLVPLVPLKSYLIVEPTTRDHYCSHRIPLSWRSVVMAWLRTGLLGVVGASGLITTFLFTDLIDGKGNESALWVGVTALMASGLLFGSCMLLNRAGFLRAVELGAVLGIEALEMEQVLATSRSSLWGTVSWYLSTFSIDGSPRPLSSRGADDGRRPSPSRRERPKD